MKLTSILRAAFWGLLVLFFWWDWSHSAAVDVRQEPPLWAAGSGKVVDGGHCSAAK